jgi:serine/threonine protein phosphatase PrpC
MNAKSETAMRGLNEKDTIDWRPGDFTPVGSQPASSSAHIRAELAGATHRGLVRANNEDHYLAVRFGRTLEVVSSNVPEDLVPRCTEELGYGLLVADGVGGAAAGETASRLAISTLVSLVLNTPDWLLRIGDREAETVMERMAQRYRDVDAALAETARHDAGLAGMGTTMTLACSLGSQMILAHLGDSRAYLHRADRLVRLTHDHTVAQGLADAGMIDPQDIARHRLRHVLTQALGTGRLIDPDVQRLTVAGGDQVLLCTDGLTGMVDDAAIEAILRRPGSVGETCHALIDGALQQGGKDNVTVVLARFESVAKAA